MTNYHWSIDSWGSYMPPENVDDIIYAANEIIDSYAESNPDIDDDDVRSFSETLWEAYNSMECDASQSAWKISGWGHCRGTSFSDVSECYQEIFGERFPETEESFPRFVREGWVRFYGPIAAFWEDSL